MIKHVSPGQYIFSFKVSQNVPIKGVDDKWQITANFAASSTGKFLPIQLIYIGTTPRSLPKSDFPVSVGFTKNYCSNTDKSIEFFDEIIFSYLQQVKSNTRLLLIIEFCSKNRCDILIVPHNLTNKLQALDLTVNKAAKTFSQNGYNDRISDQVARQLKSGNDLTDIKVSSKLSDLKSLHTSWFL